MLVYSQQHLVPTDVNVMTLQDLSGGYFYIHRSLYDQAVILEDQYGGNYEELSSIVSAPKPIPDDRPDVDFFHEHAPHPINILAPFLILCPDAFDSLEDMTGAISVMSSVINFKRLPRVPVELRVNVMQFSMSIH